MSCFSIGTDLNSLLGFQSALRTGTTDVLAAAPQPLRHSFPPK